MSALAFGNLLAYSLQVAMVAAAGSIGMLALRGALPKVRLLCWQGLLLACLLLPLVQPWRLNVARGNVETVSRTLSTGDPSPGSRPIPISWETVALAVAAAGILVRFSILSLGFWRLRKYRRESRFVAGAFLELQRRMNVFAGVLVSNNIAGPVTFGFLDPVIVLPENCLEDESIACHELVHVRRRDWLFTVFEEFALSIFWFHPALWWLVSEIQLAREEVVDREVISILNSRERYLEALLSLAAAKAGFDLAPASPFLRRRLLQRRVTSLLKEISMSRFRLSSSLALFAAAASLASWIGVQSFPLRAAPPQDASGITVQAGPLKVLHRTGVQYPQDALAQGIQGDVVIEVTLTATGTVADAVVVSGPEALRKAALESVLQWHFAKGPQALSKGHVTVNFQLPTHGKEISIIPAPPPESRSTVGRIIIDAPDAIKQQLESRLTLRAGDRLTQLSMNDLFTAATDVDEHLKVGLQPSPDGNATFVIITLGNPAAPAGPPQRIRIGGNVQSANLVTKVTPVYPAEAKSARIQGSVRFRAVIGKDGHILSLEVVSGHPALVQSARDAVSQWVYKPTLLNGNPVEVVTQIDVNYTLAP